jgi:hypothetical protein
MGTFVTIISEDCDENGFISVKDSTSKETHGDVCDCVRWVTHKFDDDFIPKNGSYHCFSYTNTEDANEKIQDNRNGPRMLPTSGSYD